MLKPVISPEQFVEKVNAKLKERAERDPSVRGARLRFDPDVADAAHAGGYASEPYELNGIVADAEHEVLRDFDVSIPPRRQ
ncbi:hypothetical protein CBA19CS22_00755 [Caballeronia novacaledonica]|uniref:Uncharacterized protein n=1 Tax=Caballeronia novacaledonica TaxID=1544861 RepID=A0ACB5QK63_9BURK|nr:hypothetical protein CBA19CS22_00755 [Caballeronia novacaledonica]